MPSDTFLNLSTTKKEKLETILLHVFYNRHATQVKVSEIVAAMEMSRGAFYKYFEDLEDAHAYLVKKHAGNIHGDIMRFIFKERNDFFKGIENYLAWCGSLKREDDYWKSIQLLTQRSDLFAFRRISADMSSPMLQTWNNLLKENNFSIHSSEESVSFLYFTMALVMDSLTDCLANDWTQEQLVTDFRFKSKWLLNSIKRPE